MGPPCTWVQGPQAAPPPPSHRPELRSRSHLTCHSLWGCEEGPRRIQADEGASHGRTVFGPQGASQLPRGPLVPRTGVGSTSSSAQRACSTGTHPGGLAEKVRQKGGPATLGWPLQQPHRDACTAAKAQGQGVWSSTGGGTPGLPFPRVRTRFLVTTPSSPSLRGGGEEGEYGECVLLPGQGRVQTRSWLLAPA